MIKLICISCLIWFNSTIANGQSVGIGASSPDKSAMLEIKSQSQGLLIPRMTQLERLAINSPAEGLLVYQINIDTGFYFFKSAQWTAFQYTGHSEESSIIVFTKSGNPDQIWKANIDGTNEQLINISLPNGFVVASNGDGGQIRITSDKKRIVFKGHRDTPYTYSIFSCDLDGGNVKLIINDAGTSFDID